MSDPRPTHFAMAKRVLFYVVGTKTFSLVLGGVIPSFISFSDASFANDLVDRMSMGGVIFLGNNPSLVQQNSIEVCNQFEAQKAK